MMHTKEHMTCRHANTNSRAYAHANTIQPTNQLTKIDKYLTIVGVLVPKHEHFYSHRSLHAIF